jgi:hypothetical protein
LVGPIMFGTQWQAWPTPPPMQWTDSQAPPH